MTTTTHDGAATSHPAAGGVSVPRLRTPRFSVHHVVAFAVALGVCALTLAWWLADMRKGAFQVEWLPGLWLPLGLVGLTATAELVAVRVRHGDDAVEELTILDGVVLLNTLVLPVLEAVLASLGGILLAYVLRRRGTLKTAYNLGVYAVASTATALLVRAITPAGEFDLRLILAMVVATAAFVAVNLGFMALLLSTISEATPWQVIREDVVLSVLTVIGTVGFTGTVLVVSVAAPLLLPCVVLPAAALWHAYGASAARHEERRRSERVLEYSQVLASGPSHVVALTTFLQFVQQEFEAAASLMLFEDGSALQVDPVTSTLQRLSVGAEHQRTLAAPELTLLTAAELPCGWHSAMTAPVIVDGERTGTVVIATSGRKRLRQRHLTSLSPLVGSLTVAFQNADHMKQLVQETSKLRAVVDQASDGIVVLGRHGVVEVWSPAMETISGTSAEQAVGAAIGDVLTSQDLEGNGIDPFAEGERRLSPESPRGSLDLQVVRPDGETRSTRFAHAGVFESGALVRDVILVRDLTAERQVQRMKSDFIATVSHELRTPLTPIKGYAEILRKRGDSMPPDKRARAIDVIVDRAEHLGRLVEDLLTASSIADDAQPRHSLATEVADLIPALGCAIQNFPSGVTRIRLLGPSPPLWVLCDPTRVEQVVSNLISNALKYSSDDCEVVIAVNECGGKAQVEVRDRGHGIPAEQLERIFEKFHRVEDPMVMSTGGTGLGLFIARHLARAMNGDLTAKSTVGIGSQFTLTLPLATSDHAVAASGSLHGDAPCRRSGRLTE